jgi:outer membrane protein TolC
MDFLQDQTALQRTIPSKKTRATEKKKMAMRSKFLSTLLACFIPLVVAASQPDSARYMSFSFYLDQVVLHHPVVKRAALLPQQYQLKVQAARGAFDPVLKGEYSHKQYDGKNYYEYLNGGLTIPLLPGLDIKAQVEQNTGQYLNPESSSSVPAMAYAGVSIPLGRDLLMDERRNMLRQAQTLNDASWAAQLEQINAVLLEAVTTWWDWQNTARIAEINRKGVQLAEDRVILMRSSYIQGNVAAVDTLEARLEVRKRLVDQGEANAALMKARLRASVFLWSENEEPFLIAEDVLPEPYFPEQLPVPVLRPDSALASISVVHPALVTGQAKVDQLSIEARYRRQNLLPDFRISAGALAPVGAGSVTFDPIDRFKLTAGLYMPLFLRKERAKLDEARLMVKAEQLSLDNKSREVSYYIQSNWNELNILRGMVDQQRLSVSENEQLTNAESRRFSEGESSLFIVIRRERSLLEAAEKLASLETKYFQLFTKYLWSTGRPLDGSLIPGFQ